MLKLIACFLLATLVGCITGPVPITSPYYRIPEGSQLVLKQALTIPPNTGHVFIQYGEVVTPKEKDQYYAHCWFQSWKVLDIPQIIQPDTFIVTATLKDENWVQTPGSYQLASAGIVAGFRGGDGGPSAIEYSTELTIHSALQPDIRKFACNHWEDPADAQHLTVAEMQKALGDIAEIRIHPKF